MATLIPQLRAWVSRYRVQGAAIGGSLVALAGFVAIAVRVRHSSEPVRLETARLSMASADVSGFRARFAGGNPEEELSVSRRSDSLGVSVARDSRVSLAQRVAARAESLGLTSVRVKFAPADSAAPPPRPEVSGAGIGVADYSLVLDGEGALASVLTLLGRLPPSVVLERIVGAREREASMYRLTFAVLETAPLSGMSQTGKPASSPQLAQLLEFARPLADSLRTPGTVASVVTIARDPFIALEAPVAVRLAADAPKSKAPRTEGTEWDVTATLIAGARRAALINGALVNVGEALPDGATLTAVERDRVVLTDQRGSAHTIAVKEGER